MKSLAGIGFNPTEASILLASSRPVASILLATSRPVALSRIGRVGHDLRRAVTRTRLGERLVTGRQEELTVLAAEAPKIATLVGIGA